MAPRLIPRLFTCAAELKNNRVVAFDGPAMKRRWLKRPPPCSHNGRASEALSNFFVLSNDMRSFHVPASINVYHHLDLSISLQHRR